MVGLVALVMLAQAGLTGYLLLATERQRQLEEQRAAAYQGRLLAVAKVAQDQRDALARLRDAYRDSVYRDGAAEGLPGQQLRATEMIFRELQLVGAQNSQTLEMAVVTR